MRARSQAFPDARSVNLVAPDAIRTPGRSDANVAVEHVVATGTLIAAFLAATLLVIRSLLAN
jgi:hypothetical protein